MIRLITDSSSLFNDEQSASMNMDMVPLQITIKGETYRDLSDTMPDEKFIEIINEGNIPTSSQPSIGEIEDVFNKYPNDEIIMITIADGLSGCYQSCLMAREMCEHKDNIHVINSQTICGPHRYLVEKIVEMIKDGKTVEEILAYVERQKLTAVSFLCPEDFEFLRRGGRCTPLAAKLGGLLKITPVVQETPDGKRLDTFCKARSFDIAVNKLLQYCQENADLNNIVLYVSDARCPDKVEIVKKRFLEACPTLDIRFLPLSIGFITNGGPRCIAVQWIEK
ncbi:MAG: DegV family protein [Erysipelotrichaceae bacterium]|nr:DegV family protein [Erysipelotrichaceae bacterium]